MISDKLIEMIRSTDKEMVIFGVMTALRESGGIKNFAEFLNKYGVSPSRHTPSQYKVLTNQITCYANPRGWRTYIHLRGPYYVYIYSVILIFKVTRFRDATWQKTLDETSIELYDRK